MTISNTHYISRQKSQAASALKILADFRQAQEYSHFGTELSDESKRALNIGNLINQIIAQPPGVSYSLIAQQLLMGIITNLKDTDSIDVDKLKLNVNEYAAKVKDDQQLDKVSDELLQICLTSKNSSKTMSTNQSNINQQPKVDKEEKKAAGVSK